MEGRRKEGGIVDIWEREGRGRGVEDIIKINITLLHIISTSLPDPFIRLNWQQQQQ